jgi:hypothetical protein
MALNIVSVSIDDDDDESLMMMISSRRDEEGELNELVVIYSRVLYR